jgi:hypothetical protein
MIENFLCLLVLEKKLSPSSLRASVRTVGDGEKACELPRRLGLDSCCAQVTGRAIVHRRAT